MKNTIKKTNFLKKTVTIRPFIKTAQTLSLIIGMLFVINVKASEKYQLNSIAQTSELYKDKEWNKRVYVNSFYALSGALSAELEFSPNGKWTNTVGGFRISTGSLGIAEAKISGVSYRWNYYFSGLTSQNSWVIGMGASLAYSEYRFAFLEAQTVGIVPELHAGYKWNFSPVSLFLGAGVGVANSGLILSLGYRL